MKKFFAIMLMAFTLVGFQACKENTGLALVYDVNVVGDADGNVTVTFPNGNFGLNGKTDLNFTYTNDTTKMAFADYGLSEALVSNNVKVRKAAEKVERELIAVNAASGTYYVHVTGYVKETLTGLVFAIDREFTNRKNEPVTEVNEEIVDTTIVE